MTSCMRNVSVQYFSSPKVSKRKMSLPVRTRVESSCSNVGAIDSELSHEMAIAAHVNRATVAPKAAHCRAEVRVEGARDGVEVDESFVCCTGVSRENIREGIVGCAICQV